MTVEQLQALPDPPGAWYERHHGALITVTRPLHKHYLIQQRLMDILKPLARELGSPHMELGFRPLAEHELWVADVAVVSSPRWEHIPQSGYLDGSPEIVIEALSPSNTASETLEKDAMSPDRRAGVLDRRSGTRACARDDTQ
jgi:Uma2 family endonuclease